MAVPEPRRLRGIRHPAAAVLAFAAAAVLAGAGSVTAAAGWAADVPPEALQAPGAWRDRKGRLVPPSLKTFRRVLRRLDGQAVAAASGRWLRGQVLTGLADAGTLVIALDGKTARGARGRDGTAPHLLAAMICGARAVLAQKDVDARTNKITRVRPLLAEVDAAGALITADALHVQKDTAKYIAEDKDADCLFTAVKDSQPSPFAALDALTGRTRPSPTSCTTAGTDGTRPARSRCCLPRTGCFPMLRRRS